jgi:YggT family protein
MVLIFLAIQVLIWIIIADAILSWFPNIDRRNPLVITLRAITAPIYKPIREIIPPSRTGYVDLAPLVVIILLQVLSFVLRRVLV